MGKKAKATPVKRQMREQMNSFTAQSYFGGDNKTNEEAEMRQQGKPSRKNTRKNDRQSKLCKLILP